VPQLMAAIAELLPVAAGDADGPVSGTVFKVERSAVGEKIAYIRMFSGTIRTRDRLHFGLALEDKVTAIQVFERGSAERRTSVSAGEIGRLWGLHKVQIGDRIGRSGTEGASHQFAPPTMESVVTASNPHDRTRLRVALGQLAEQDPLINVRQDDSLNELSVSLYGEVQKEVIQATLANDFGLDVTFRATTTIYIERPVGTGEALEVLQAVANPTSATIGLRVDPAPIGSGVEFHLDVHARTVPLYLYKTAGRFLEVMTEYICDTFQEGLFGWRVTDCVVTMTASGYYVGDGPAKPSGSTPRTTAADFRKLTPLVLMLALKRAGTVVCEPMVRVRIETPSDVVGAVLASVAQLGGVVEPMSLHGDLSTIETVMPAARAQDLQRRLPGLTGGEGVSETNFGGYEPVSGAPPTRRRSRPNPLNRKEYLRHLGRSV
jgi:ribosomal protection tetracycline resistance protein